MPDQDRFREVEHLSTQHSRGSNAVDVRYDSGNYLYNFFDYEQGSSEPIVRGRMKANIDFWKHIGAHDDILQVIEHGYKLPLLTAPPPAHFKNNYSALNNYDFVIIILISKLLVVETFAAPEIINPLSVSIQSSGKKRLILDLRYINHHIWKHTIIFDDCSIALQYFIGGCFMFSFDLKSGYHHIDIFPDHRKFLSFAWKIDGVTRYFSFQVLPFGLSSAPCIFTKCIRPLVKHWREKGFFIVVYLVDGWCTASSFNECKSVADSVKDDLSKAGLVPNIEKSVAGQFLVQVLTRVK